MEINGQKMNNFLIKSWWLKFSFHQKNNFSFILTKVYKTFFDVFINEDALSFM